MILVTMILATMILVTIPITTTNSKQINYCLIIIIRNFQSIDVL